MKTKISFVPFSFRQPPSILLTQDKLNWLFVFLFVCCMLKKRTSSKICTFLVLFRPIVGQISLQWHAFIITKTEIITEQSVSPFNSQSRLQDSGFSLEWCITENHTKISPVGSDKPAVTSCIVCLFHVEIGAINTRVWSNSVGSILDAGYPQTWTYPTPSRPLYHQGPESLAGCIEDMLKKL